MGMLYEYDAIDQGALFHRWVCDWCGQEPSKCLAAQAGQTITLIDAFETGREQR